MSIWLSQYLSTIYWKHIAFCFGGKFTPDDITDYSLTKAIELNFDLNSFRCEKEDFNQYFHSIAPKDHNDNIGKLWLFTIGKRKKIVVGFVTLAMSQLSKLEHEKLCDMTTHKHIPALLLGQMVRHEDYKGKGLGPLMRDWVIAQALDYSKNIGCRLIILESVHDKVKMYEEWGFIPIVKSKNKRNTTTMFADLAWHGQ